MSSSPLITDRGNNADFVLGTQEGWGAFRVVRWHAVEEISRLFEFDITLLRTATEGPIDPAALVDTAATFRIATGGRFRAVHGVLAEVEEVDRTPELILYRVLLVPHFWRAKYRRRCRNFVDKTLKDILTAVFEGKSPAHPNGHRGLAAANSSPTPPPADPDWSSFQEPAGLYRWAVTDEARITDATVSPYIVQYNESDFAFASRLLEEEGISYYFVHAAEGLVMVLTDAPGQAPLFDEDAKFVIRGAKKGGASEKQEIVRSLRRGTRMRSRAVTMREYDYNRSANPLESTIKIEGGGAEEHFEFPGGDEVVQSKPTAHGAKIRLERQVVERDLREGTSTVRSMEPGHAFDLVDGDGFRADEELLCVRAETWATEMAPEGTALDQEPFGFDQRVGAPSPGFDARFQAIAKAAQFRPALATPHPRVHGVHTAVVTAEEVSGQRPEINVDDQGRVRLRFHWDQRPDSADGTPTSNWVRVSHYWAGSAFGALYHPRVGQEVLVAYLHGDPDRPVIVGRVYNAQNPPPYDGSQYPTRSTIKSHTQNPDGPGYNEIRFEDAATLEEIFLHAQKDFNEVVENCHSTSVGGDQSNSVGGNQSNSVTGNRTHDVKGTEGVHVVGDRTTTFDANESHSVAGFLTTQVGANEKHQVGGFRNTSVGANDDLSVTGWRNTKVGGGETLNVGSKRDVVIAADHNLVAGGALNSKSATTKFDTGVFSVLAPVTLVDSSMTTIKAGSAVITMSSGMLILSNGAGATVALVGGTVIVSGASSVNVVGGGAKVDAAGSLGLKGGGISLDGGGSIDAKAGEIKLNG